PEWASVLSSRRQLALRQPFQRYRAVGVSFGGAQEAVKLLQPGSPLLIQQEPDNEHDAQAVLLCDLAGRRLGYVPRADTDQFPHPLVVGRVESVGANPTSGLWGFQVDALAALNQWTEEEGEAYVGHLQRGKQWEGRWSVDVSLLTRERLPTPPGLPLGI
ncbi:hypothetical protein APUTEX25_001114, partial [Auxenochlorella protothecoides]